VQRNGRGDELVLVRVAVPEKLSRKQKKLFEELSDTLAPESVVEEKQGLMDEVREFLGL
jgi:molecular chaperone DnaJ